MIMIAFVALIVTVMMQQVYLQRAQVREQLYRAIAEKERADAQVAISESASGPGRS